MRFLAGMEVTLMDHMGDDQSIAGDFRISLNRSDKEFAPDENRALLSKHIGHGHTSPTRHTAIKFEFFVPIFVARQMMRHNVGGSWNEMSMRYTDMQKDACFYVPNRECGRAAQFAMDQYRLMRDRGCKKEDARMVLPVTIYTRLHCTGTLQFWANFCHQRLSPHAQKEIREVARKVALYCETLFPTAWPLLVESYEK